MSAAKLFDDVRAVYTDVDGTLTTDGRLASSTYTALEALEAAGVPIVVVTGRSAGWGDALFRLWPVRAVVTENGGVSFLRTARGRKKVFAVPERTLAATRRKMYAAAAAVARAVPGARLSVDSIYTEVNLAIDWNEDARLPESAARRIETFLRGKGYNAVRSSVHVNFWPGRFDKLTACKRVARALDLPMDLYVGDALNDEPMFRGFPRSVGVANIRKVWDDLRWKPTHVTRAAEGAGFEEVARAILASLRRRPSSARRGSSARRPGS